MVALMSLPGTYHEDKCCGKQLHVPTIGVTPTYAGPVDVQVKHLSWIATYESQVLGDWDICASHWDVIEAFLSQRLGTSIYQNN